MSIKKNIIWTNHSETQYLEKKLFCTARTLLTPNTPVRLSRNPTEYCFRQEYARSES